MKTCLGRFVYGLAAIGCGVCTLVWHDIDALGSLAHRALLVDIAAVGEIFGGFAVLWPRTTRAGAFAQVIVFCAFALVGIPLIVRQPLAYNNYGNFFEQFSQATGAILLLGVSGSDESPRSGRWAWFGTYSFGLCVISFGLEQLFYLKATAGFVPKWIPPGPMFWAIATTVAFFLAAFSLLTGFKALLAARLTTAMLVVFGLLVWMPALFANPHSFGNWSETAETFAIVASAWVVGDFLGQQQAAGDALARPG